MTNTRNRDQHATAVADRHIRNLMAVVAVLQATADPIIGEDVAELANELGSMVMKMADVRDVRALVALAQDFEDLKWDGSERLMAMIGSTDDDALHTTLKAMSVLLAEA